MLPVMDQVFTDNIPNDAYIFIDKLELDLGSIPASNFENEIAARLKKSLHDFIRQHSVVSLSQSVNAQFTSQNDFPNKPEQANILTKLGKKEAIKKAFFEFLVSGNLPLWYTGGNIKSLENELISGGFITEPDLDKIIDLCKKHTYIPKRIALQFTPLFMDYIFSLKKDLLGGYEESGLRLLYRTLEDTGKNDNNTKLNRWWINIFREKMIALLFETLNFPTVSKIKIFIYSFYKDLPLQEKISFNLIISLTKQKLKTGNTYKQSLLFDIIDTWDEFLGAEKISHTSGKEEIIDQSLPFLRSDPGNNNSTLDTYNNKVTGDSDFSDPQHILNELETQEYGLKQYVQSFFAPTTTGQEEYFFIRNSGLVILAPYIQMFFKALNLLNNIGFINDFATCKGIFLLHYLCSKTNIAEEKDLLLNKIICGIPLEYPVPQEMDISEIEANEAENLLNAIVRNWTVLKNTSPDGLREGFLQREGKLSIAERGWKLKVEQKPIDILLNSIPWSYNVIKLPWMNNYILVEWN
jgi:hypothetical protein